MAGKTIMLDTDFFLNPGVKLRPEIQSFSVRYSIFIGFSSARELFLGSTF